MSQAISIPVIPESAPFSTAQRAWLNGFLAGMLSRQRSDTKPEMPATPATQVAPAQEESFPWHDPALSMDERLKLADGKPFDRVLMSAMAQLDCGACGYVCQTYSEAIARGEDKDLNKCAPGGKETARKLKDLIANRSSFAPATVEVTVKSKSISKPAGYDRNNPFPAALLECKPLNGPRSAKDTRFVSLDLSGSGLLYRAGDALGIYPENCPDTVQWIVDQLDASGNDSVPIPSGKKAHLAEALQRHYTITKPSDALLELLMTSATDASERTQLKAMLDGDGAAAGIEVLDLLRQFRSARPKLDQFVAALLPMQHRLYSISSSPRTTPEQVHLTVGVVRFLSSAGRQCKGVASTFLAERLAPGQKVRVFVHPAKHFGLPKDPRTPMIMVGPGTGIAPFRSFLYERKAIGAPSRNWLFFGDQRQEHDFLYRDELEGFVKDGLLTRLDLAFSRDQKQKLYVQHRMMENAAELWNWLKEGAHFYVCGDAKRMAHDVDLALRSIVEREGGMSADAAKAYVAEMSKAGRYQRDVY
jgi:sulfite reductase (NADPH) flavoprotein alpha-component